MLTENLAPTELLLGNDTHGMLSHCFITIISLIEIYTCTTRLHISCSKNLIKNDWVIAKTHIVHAKVVSSVTVLSESMDQVRPKLDLKAESNNKSTDQCVRPW